MVSLKSPVTLIILLLLTLIVGFFLAYVFGFVLNSTQAIIALAILIGMGILIFILWLLRQNEDPMLAAMKYVEEKIRDKFHEDVQTKEMQGYHRSFGLNNEEYGFIYKRSTGDKKGIPIAVVVEKHANGFKLKKINEHAVVEMVKNNPFLNYETKYTGAPIPNPSLEMQQGIIMPGSDKKGVVVNVGDKKDNWTDDANKK